MQRLSSLTTGVLDQAARPRNSTGLPSGGTGSAISSIGAGTAADNDKALLTRLRSECGFFVEVRTRLMFPEGNKPSYSVPDSVFASRSATADPKAARRLMAEFAAPAPYENRLKMAMFLKAACKARAEGEMMTAAQFEVIADAFARYPADVATDAVEELSRTSVFHPSLAEITTALDRKAATRRAIARALENEAARPAPPPKQRITPEQAAAVKARHAELAAHLKR